MSTTCPRCFRITGESGADPVYADVHDERYCWTDRTPAVYDVADYACLLAVIARLEREVAKWKADYETMEKLWMSDDRDEIHSRRLQEIFR